MATASQTASFWDDQIIQIPRIRVEVIRCFSLFQTVKEIGYAPWVCSSFQYCFITSYSGHVSLAES